MTRLETPHWQRASTADLRAVFISSSIPVYKTHLPDLPDQVSGMLVDNLQRRATLAKFPNGDEETTFAPHGLIPGAVSWLPPPAFPPPVQIACASPLRTSGSSWQQWETGIGGGCSVFTPPESFWCGPTAAPNRSAGYSCTSGLQYNDTLLPRAPYQSLTRPYQPLNPSYQSSPASTTTVDNTTGVSIGRAVVHFWHPAHWASLMGRVDHQNTTKHTLAWSYGGFQSARGVSDGKEWFLQNLPEELDYHNEYWYDHRTGMLYYAYNASSLPNITFDVMSPLRTLVRIEVGGSLWD